MRITVPSLAQIGRAVKSVLSPVGSARGWNMLIKEPFTGAWQQNKEISVDLAVSHYAVYSCVTLIANDVGKLRWRLLKTDEDGIWSPTENSAYSPVLRKPNRYQNYIQFKEWWITSKLLRGNTYVLKQRDARGVVIGLYILDPDRVMVLVADDGSVFYQLGEDNLTGLTGGVQVTVPASEIIHDRINPLFHPLIGISPLIASALAAGQGLAMQKDASTFFANGSRPGGVLTAPGSISDDTAKRLKDYFDENFSGDNRGKIAVLGDDLKYTPLRMTATDAQVVEQFGFTSKIVCSTFHVPPFKVQLETLPAGMKVSDINLLYYGDCLQTHIEEMEACMDEGLGLGTQYEVNVDVSGLMRMDEGLQAEILTKYVDGGVMAPNEARKRVNLGPLKGGNTVYLQQQQYSMAALAKRDAETAAPHAGDMGQTTATPAPAPAPVAEADAEKQFRELISEIKKGLTHV